MKAVFVVNGTGHWICLEVVDSAAAANAVVDSYAQTDINENPITRQFYVVDLPAIENQQG